MIRFKCSSCQKAYKVKSEYAGRNSKCTACGMTTRIPSHPQPEPTQPQEDGIIAAEIVARETPTTHSGPKPMTAVPNSTIQFSISFFPLAFFFFACTPVVEVNGRPSRLGWGTHQFEFAPGDYWVKIYFHYFWMSECGANLVSFRLEPGANRHVSFYMWPWMFAKGTMKVS